ncbi:TolC family outer membrane protein [Fontimonas sp. SYSU GA230001]|uniref:TolC family outer membrane protein n=1 Tax=Fontimonas sp. SYSU GA230001 TaxID=3142450 RepID=UPI0032B4C759
MISAAKTSCALALLAFVAAAPVSAMTLGEALQRASERDPAVAVALAQYEAERELGAQERGSLLPTLGIGGAYDYAQTDGSGVFGSSRDSYPAWSAQVQARQPLFRLDWFARRERARALDDRAEAARIDRRLKILVRVAERYFGVLNAQDQLAQAEAEAKAVRESLEDTRKRYEVELVPGTDLKEAQARDDLAQARLLSARTALETAREALDEVTGNGHVALPVLPEDVAFPALQPADAEQWVEAARAQSPAIALARQAAQIADADRRSALSSAMPTLDVVASVSRQDNSEYDFGQKVDDARVGVELQMPLYTGGVNTARIRQAKANAAAAEAELRRVTLETERSARQLYRQVVTAYYESDAFKKSLESAQAAEAATRAGYDAGTRTITDVLDAKSRVVQARRDLNGTRYRLLQLLIQLRQTTGELTEQDFARIDDLLRYPAAR